ncbi:MAG: methyl-accepting chemotaxis protein [Candidatus Omnitrophota bacterium]
MRIRFITKNPLQFKYLALILSSILIPLFITGGSLYYIIFQVMAEQLAIPESIACNLIPVLNKVNVFLLVSLPPVVLLLFMWGTLLTHKLMGPLERLGGDLKKISEGDYSIRLSLRKNDDLRSVADSVNKIINRLQKR